MDPFLKRVFNVIEKYHMFGPGCGVIAGVSGGADSVCLLRCLLSWKEERRPDLRLFVVHVEHGLRGQESLGDASFVEELSRSLGVPFFMERIRMEEIAREEGLSPEEAGRWARNHIFARYEEKLGANTIALAHHAGDQAETVLMNLARGTGLKGLGGMAPVRDDVVRPLLFETRTEIEAYLRRIGQDWRTDRTNLQTDYTRNKIRLKVLPYLEEEVNAGSVLHICGTAEKVRQAEDFLEAEALRRLENCVTFGDEPETEQARIDTDAFLREPEIMQSGILRLVFRRLRGGLGLKDISARHIESVRLLAAGGSGRRLDLPGFTAGCSYGVLRIERKRPDGGKARDFEVNGAGCPAAEEAVIDTRRGGTYRFGGFEFTVRVIRGCDIPAAPGDVIPQKEYTKWLRCDRINSRICIRTRRPGDYLAVDAAGNRQTLNRYMINSKIERSRRDEIPLVADGNHILWAVGCRISEDAKVDRQMSRVLEISARTL